MVVEEAAAAAAAAAALSWLCSMAARHASRTFWSFAEWGAGRRNAHMRRGASTCEDATQLHALT